MRRKRTQLDYEARLRLTGTPVTAAGTEGDAVIAPPFPVEPTKSVSARSRLKETFQSPARLAALMFFGISAVLTLLAFKIGFPAMETGLLCVLTASAATIVLRALPKQNEIARGGFAIATGIFTCLAALVLLPAVNLWPSGAGPLIFAMIFCMIGTLVRSKACLAIAVAALFGLMVDADGLTRMRLDGQLAVLILFAIGLIGSVLSGSRIMSSVTLVAVMGSALTLMASFGIPSSGALATLSIFAVTTALALRAYWLQGHVSAEIPMILAALTFALAAIGFQLFLLGEVAGRPGFILEPMPNLGVMILIALQGMVLFVSLVSWLAGRMSLSDLLLTQALFGLVCTVIADPFRLVRLGFGNPSIVLTAIVAVIVGTLAAISLYRSWKNYRPILTALSAMIFMVQVNFGLRLLTGTFDIALGALVCGGIAVGLAVLMTLNPRNAPQTRFS
ncbi:MAG: hypothetical protein AAFP97_13180 [Pseudomonadota bacterium]